MRDVATRRGDWRRLTLAKGRRLPFRWCCLSAVVLAVGCASTHHSGCSPLVRVNYGPPLVSALRAGGTGDASGTSRESRPLLRLRRYSGGAAPRRGDAGWACRSRQPAVGGRTELATRAGGSAVRSAIYSCKRKAGPATRRRRQHGTCHSNRSPVQLPYNQRRRALASLSLSDRLRVSPGDVKGMRRNLRA